MWPRLQSLAVKKQFVILFEIWEDDEEKRKQKNASLAMAAFAQKGAGKDKAKPVCRDYMTDEGCKRGGQCSYQQIGEVGRTKVQAHPKA